MSDPNFRDSGPPSFASRVDTRQLGADARLTGEVDQSAPDLRHYVRIVLRRRYVVLFCVLVSLLLGALQLRYETPIYSATALMKYEPRRERIVGFEDLRSEANWQVEIDTLIQLVRSQRVAMAVTNALRLGAERRPGAAAPQQAEKSPIDRVSEALSRAWGSFQSALVRTREVPIDPTLAAQESRLQKLIDSVSVSRRFTTRIIQVTVRHEDPVMAARIADEFCNQFMLIRNNDETESYRYARDLLDRQIRETRERLLAAERALSLYVSQDTTTTLGAASSDTIAVYDLRLLEQQRDQSISTMKQLTDEIERLRSEVSTYSVESQAASDESVRRLLIANDPAIGRLVERANELEIERIALSADNQADFPKLRATVREIAVVNDQITSATAAFFSQATARLSLAKLRLAALEDRRASQENVLRDIQRTLRDYATLERDVTAEQELYKSLVDRSKELIVTGSIEPSDLAVVGRASIPRSPTSPRLSRTLVFFGLVGFLFGLGLVLSLHWFDRTITDPNEVERTLGLPALGFLPYLSRSRRAGFLGRRSDPISLITNYNAKSPEVEAFRYVRTSLQYSSAGAPPQVLVVTSCMPKEGKSTAATNLAMSFTERDHDVLLIDCDLKAPNIHRGLSISRIPGLSDVLTGQVSAADAIVPYEGMKRLFVLPAGPPTPSPIDLFDSRAMRQLLSELRGRYGTIVIDSPPCYGIADTLVLAGLCDGVCLVVDRGRTQREVLRKVVQSLERARAHIFGVLYNSSRRRLGGAGLEDGYGYGYGYGAYGSKDPSTDGAEKG